MKTIKSKIISQSYSGFAFVYVVLCYVSSVQGFIRPIGWVWFTVHTEQLRFG